MNIPVRERNRPPASNPELWTACQRIAYPGRIPSKGSPFARETCSPKRRPASWLYYTLLDNPGLRIDVIGVYQ